MTIERNDADPVLSNIIKHEIAAAQDDPADHLRLVREHLDIYLGEFMEVTAPAGGYEVAVDNLNYAMARLCELLDVSPEEIL